MSPQILRGNSHPQNFKIGKEKREEMGKDERKRRKEGKKQKCLREDTHKKVVFLVVGPRRFYPPNTNGLVVHATYLIIA